MTGHLSKSFASKLAAAKTKHIVASLVFSLMFFFENRCHPWFRNKLVTTLHLIDNLLQPANYIVIAQQFKTIFYPVIMKNVLM